jgi:hypothetical protein
VAVGLHGRLFKAHALEIPFVFDGVDAAPITARADRQALADLMARRGSRSPATPTTRRCRLEALHRRAPRHADLRRAAARPTGPRQEELDAWRGVELRRV